MQQLGKVLRDGRRRLGVNQTDFAQAVTATGLASCSAGYINKLERGTSSGHVSAALMQAFAVVLGWPVERLYQEAGMAPAPARPPPADIPPDVLAALGQVAPGMRQEQWDLLIEIARQTTQATAERETQRQQRAEPPAEETERPDPTEPRPPRPARQAFGLDSM
jgi:transcriptional regulator with XRE-family HTH domain